MGPQRRYQAQQGLGIMETSTAPPPISGAPTSIALFVGWAPSGPTDRALPLSSFSEYAREFGGLDARSLLCYAVRHFYENGGSYAFVLRITAADGGVIVPNDLAFVEALNAAFSPGGPVDGIDMFNLICVPGLADPAATTMLQAQAAARRAFLIADCEETAQAATVAASLAGKTGAHAANSALYFPWILAPDPLQQGASRAFPPSGFIAGAFARTDSAHGVWKSPAGTGVKLIGAADIAVHLTDAENKLLTAQGINCLRKFPETGPVVWGARTLAGGDGNTSDWKYVPVRRTALFFEQSLYAGTNWAVFEPNDEALWARLRLSVSNFMEGLFNQGAFAADTPAHAYFVKCGADTTTQADIDRGVVNIVVGFAPLKPAEFVMLRIVERTATS
jgi:phage tail sheath protein FI